MFLFLLLISVIVLFVICMFMIAIFLTHNFIDLLMRLGAHLVVIITVLVDVNVFI